MSAHRFLRTYRQGVYETSEGSPRKGYSLKTEEVCMPQEGIALSSPIASGDEATWRASHDPFIPDERIILS